MNPSEEQPSSCKRQKCSNEGAPFTDTTNPVNTNRPTPRLDGFTEVTDGPMVILNPGDVLDLNPPFPETELGEPTFEEIANLEKPLFNGCVDMEEEDLGLPPAGLSLIHISEPTRRTPISYAVFCLKKKAERNRKKRQRARTNNSEKQGKQNKKGEAQKKQQ